ncbi:hypothetical protein E8E13_001872 [Curvularia kusanoi]|uniref:Heterokaryon incompatibility domain-containing protein n=1 Tax=Curvularia kusanoi TaxID=90978 RepID=A0A9P4W2M7_CURKU|nr:hypothetical protein E8E13_001872 [Curvularia kusanoi]
MAICSLSRTRLKCRIAAFLSPLLVTKQDEQQYQYTPLKTNQIRLLKLHPGQPGSQIECTIKAVDLLACDDFNSENTNDKDWEWFHAVSYAWGKGARSVKIKCNGLVAYISQTLADALQTFREKDDLILWIDALCINQNDIRERAAQVKLMDLIYFKARRVRIWLGRDDEADAVHSAEGAADLIKTFAELWNSCRDGDICEVSERLFQDPDIALLPQWEGIRRLYQRPWFSRVWVVQELGLAEDATFYSGQGDAKQHKHAND